MRNPISPEARNSVDHQMPPAARPWAAEPSAPGGRIHREACGAVSTPPRAGRWGFTLVELMVVIAIISLIAAISVPVVMQSLARARNAAIKAEIDMLHMAIMNYKAEYGSFPPCYDTIAISTGTDTVSRHILRLFPRVSSGTAASYQAQRLSYRNSEPFSLVSGVAPENALVYWLYGFTSAPDAPIYTLVSGSAVARQKLVDFDTSRISTADSSYFPSGKPLSAYVYIDRSRYLTAGGGAVDTRVLTSGTYYAQRIPASPSGSFNVVSQPAFNPDSFQILCAGRDEVFGNDDDLSNFWPGTRRDYLDSLR